MQIIKILLKAVAVLIFALALISTVAAYAIQNIPKNNVIQVALLEISAKPTEEAVLFTFPKTSILINVFCFSIAALGLCLILLYFLSGSFKIFLAPAITSFFIFLIGQVIFSVISIPEGLSMSSVLEHSLERAQQANYFLLIGSIILFFLSFKKVKPRQKLKLAR